MRLVTYIRKYLKSLKMKDGGEKIYKINKMLANEQEHVQ